MRLWCSGFEEFRVLVFGFSGSVWALSASGYASISLVLHRRVASHWVWDPHD